MISFRALAVVVAQDILHHPPDQFLLRRNLAGCVDWPQSELFSEMVVGSEDAALENLEALDRIARRPRPCRLRDT